MVHFLGGDSVGMQENIRTSSSDAGFKMKRQDLPDKIILSYANGTQLLMKKFFFSQWMCTVGKWLYIWVCQWVIIIRAGISVVKKFWIFDTVSILILTRKWINELKKINQHGVVTVYKPSIFIFLIKHTCGTWHQISIFFKVSYWHERFQYKRSLMGLICDLMFSAIR